MEELNQDPTLVKRVQKLIEENRDLNNQMKQLSAKNDELSIQIDTLKTRLSKLGDSAKDLQLDHTQTIKFKMATVLFLEIHGFKSVSGEEDSKEIIDELDNLFYQFDDITANFKIEKIKTIGDTYMCAGGVPIKNITNPLDVVLSALEMYNVFNETKEKYTSRNKPFYEMKIGIHTGPVIANTSGKKKISYDLKGETVNTASRMMSAAENGMIIISVMTYELVKDYFTCEHYGKMPVKMQGNMDMYSVKRIKVSLSENREGRKPNEIFRNSYLMRQLTDFQEIILEKLEKELPSFLFYHNVKHTIDVATQAELIAWGEGISDEDILLLKTAAILHDVGQIQGAKDHEDRGAAMAKEILPNYGYAPQQIETICELIMATKLPPNPQNLLQQIMCDSDLDYLGRSDFIPVSNTLFEELKAQNIITNINDWNKIQVKFLSVHQFYTKTANTLRSVNKQQQIDRIKSIIED